MENTDYKREVEFSRLTAIGEYTLYLRETDKKVGYFAKSEQFKIYNLYDFIIIDSESETDFVCTAKKITEHIRIDNDVTIRLYTISDKYDRMFI